MRAAVAAADPFPLTRAALDRHHDLLQKVRDLHVIAAGKAAWPMAMAAAGALGSKIRSGVAVGTRGAGDLPETFTWIDGAHPAPDDSSVRAAGLAASAASAASESGAGLLVLLSGGASSMLASPVEGITLSAKQQTIDALSRIGTPIEDLNCVRKHLSTIKGGRLARLASGNCLTLAVSDVHDPPDDPSTIGSGPTAGDPSTFRDALRVIADARLHLPSAVVAHLERGAAGDAPETVKPDDPVIARARYKVIANRWTALRGAEEEAVRLGYEPRVSERAITGQASAAGRAFVEDAVAARLRPGSCVIASGETTVAVRGNGRGGRNQEFALAAADTLARVGPMVVLCSVGTDGIDGPTDAAGAIVTSKTGHDARAQAIDLRDVLSRNDAYPALERLHALVRTGPTLTNVGDLHVLLTSRASL